MRVSGLPVIMIRTPYDKRSTAPEHRLRGLSPARATSSPSRTCGASSSRKGTTPSRKLTFDDGSDATTGWPRSRGRTERSGPYGCSYLGDTQVMQARVRNPHHAAMLPQAAGSSIHYRYFGSMDGGVFELAVRSDGFATAGSKLYLRYPDDMPQAMRQQFKIAPAPPPIADYRTIWSSLPLVDMMKKAGGPPTDFEDFVSHRARRSLVGPVRLTSSRTTVSTCPSLQVNSWYDFGVAETLQQFNQFRTNAVSARARDNQFIIISPTEHCRSERATENTRVGQREISATPASRTGISTCGGSITG